jgi:4-amino-4-deoxy-L-arabinose transferase-like glycosyltransferase
MNTKENYFIRFLRDNWVILLIASLNFFILFIPNLFGYYGYLRDELYIIACSKRLAFGYIDHPPFAVFLMSIIRFFLGDSILAIRLLPALANAVLIFLIGIITKRLGGKKFAQGLAGFAFSIMPFYLMMNAFYSMTGFEPLLLTCCVLVLIIIIQENKQRYWLILGLIIGIGIINKYTFVIFGVASVN